MHSAETFNFLQLQMHSAERTNGIYSACVKVYLASDNIIQSVGNVNCESPSVTSRHIL
jgi:hypothetical protein